MCHPQQGAGVVCTGQYKTVEGNFSQQHVQSCHLEGCHGPGGNIYATKNCKDYKAVFLYLPEELTLRHLPFYHPIPFRCIQHFIILKDHVLFHHSSIHEQLEYSQISVLQYRFNKIGLHFFLHTFEKISPGSEANK
jgi:hypothetical protein